ncbi:hypothetical protein [Aquirufa sp. A-Brett2-W8]
MFSETQRFTQWWLWLVLLVSWGALIYALATEPPQSTLSYIISYGLGLLLPLLFCQMKLKTRIEAEGIYVRFFPFHFREKFYAWDSISACYVRDYSPLKEYGGWGIKYSFNGNGLVYNVAGSVGLQLNFKEGEPVLIGTQKGEEIKAKLVEMRRLIESVK